MVFGLPFAGRVDRCRRPPGRRLRVPLGLYALSVAGCRIARRLGSIRLPVGGFVVRCFLVKSGACMAGAWIRGEPKEWSLLQAAALACLWVDQSQGMLRLLVGHLLRLLESGGLHGDGIAFAKNLLLLSRASH